MAALKVYKEYGSYEEYDKASRELRQEIQAERRGAIKCAHCGHKDTKAEVQRRRAAGGINDEPRRFCSPSCQRAAWEKQNGTRRKREYRAKKSGAVPMVVHRVPPSGHQV